MVLLHSSLARVGCASGRNRNNCFYGVKSSSSSPGAPGITADFALDRNKHFFKKVDSLSSYLGLVGLALLLFPSNMYAQLSQHFCLVRLVTFYDHTVGF